jgi:hypothetical protein
MTVRASNGNKYYQEFSGYMRGNSSTEAPLPSLPDVDEDVALQEALSRAQTDAWDGLTFMAEFRKTLELFLGLRGRYERLLDMLATKTKSLLRRGLVRADAIAQAWLELRYAWRPLVYDMFAMQEALQRLADGIDDPIRRAWATRSGSNTTNSVVEGNFGGPNGVLGMQGFTCRTTNSRVRTVTAHAALAIQVRTREVLQLDPFVTAWELIKWSFVVDWFTTIGDLIGAFSPFATGSLLWSTIAVEDHDVSTSITTPRNTLTIVSGSFSPSIRIIERRTYERTLASPTPTLALDVNLDVWKILDLLALWKMRDKKLLTRIMRHS